VKDGSKLLEVRRRMEDAGIGTVCDHILFIKINIKNRFYIDSRKVIEKIFGILIKRLKKA
jgi:hypothetical protein